MNILQELMKSSVGRINPEIKAGSIVLYLSGDEFEFGIIHEVSTTNVVPYHIKWAGGDADFYTALMTEEYLENYNKLSG